MTIEEARMFIRNYDEYEKFFGIELVTKCVTNFKVEDFSTKEFVALGEGTDNYYSRKGYPVLIGKTRWTFKEYKGEWSREVEKPAVQYLVPDHYQLKESRLLRACLLKRFPYLCEFDFPTYHMEKPFEIYIKCDNGCSLYVPLEALEKKDFSIIEKRVKDYFGWYYNTPERKEYLDKELSTLTTETALKLKEFISK